MRQNKLTICLVAGLLLGVVCSYGQAVDSVANKVVGLPSRLLGRIRSKTASLDQQLTKQTQKYLQRMAGQEEKMRKKLFAVDSVGAKNLFGNQGPSGSNGQYAVLGQRLATDTGSRSASMSGEYQPYTDSLRGTLAFLQQNPQWSGNPVAGMGATLSGKQAQLQQATSQLQSLQAKMQDAGMIQQYLQQRNAQIQQYLSRYTQLPSGLTNDYNNYKQQLYYYDQQVREYKEMLNDPDKMLKTALGVLDKLPAYTSFMKNNSVLAGILNMPGGSTPGMGGPGAAAAGMPTRDQVLAGLQSQMGGSTGGALGATGGSTGDGAGPAGATGGSGPIDAGSLVQQNVGSAQGQLDQIRDKVNAGGGGADLNMPDFKPNGQKTKTFLRRLEYGVNLQTDHSTTYFPTTTDIGLSLGYKLNDHNRVGIGTSYKVGWGSDIQHIRVSSQGASLRSFLDVQVKKSWFASGGFEYNYQQPFYTLHALRDLSNWQQSGLIGVSKIVSMKTKVFKNTKLQLLWDFLSYQQLPKAQAFQFRVGYSF